MRENRNKLLYKRKINRYLDHMMEYWNLILSYVCNLNHLASYFKKVAVCLFRSNKATYIFSSLNNYHYRQARQLYIFNRTNYYVCVDQRCCRRIFFVYFSHSIALLPENHQQLMGMKYRSFSRNGLRIKCAKFCMFIGHKYTISSCMPKFKQSILTHLVSV